MSKILEHCIICGERPLKANEMRGRYLSLPPSHKILYCSQCGLGWLHPQPGDADFALYDAGYYQEIERGKASYCDIVPGKLSYFRRRIRIIQRLTRKRTLKVLDVGAGCGEFVYEARKAGWEAEGVEISPWACAKALEMFNVRLIQGELQAVKPTNQPFDIIHMNHVFEHLTDPLGFLNEAADYLRTDGILIVEIPNEFSDLVSIIQMYLLRVRLPFNTHSLHHPFFYTRASVNKMFRKAGYDLHWLGRADWRPFIFKDAFPLNYVKAGIMCFQSLLHFPSILVFIAKRIS